MKFEDVVTAIVYGAGFAIVAAIFLAMFFLAGGAR